MRPSGLLLLLSQLFLAVFLFPQVAAECPNACSAHGKCGAYDACTCYRNWISNDCSERLCQFHLAHVDTPKGDLDASGGALTGPDVSVIPNSQIYPYGTTEQFPEIVDTSGNVLTNAGHEYRECSNKGICDRSTGTCNCFEGYEGSGCQRASCPTSSAGVCSGHGVCKTIKELTYADSEVEYRLWDKDATMGCECDGGYSGADCSQKLCKTGFDPLYFDDGRTKRYQNLTVVFYTLSPTALIKGNYSLVFHSALGETYQTDPIPIASTCTDLTNYLESLPNNVIPTNSLRCYRSEVSLNNPVFASNKASGQSTINTPIIDSSMYVFESYTIAFPRNAGELAQLDINIYLDGDRPTLYTDESSSTLGYKVYANGFTSEEVDYVPTRCEGVIATLSTVTPTAFGGYVYLDSLTAQEVKLLKVCLGGSDSATSNNVDVYNWDYGSAANPHLIKLQDATQYSYVGYDSSVDGTLETAASIDPMLIKEPVTQLCDVSAGNAAKYGKDGDNIGYCSNKDPPAFYAILIYDSGTATFRIYHNIAQDYASTTQFFIYTTDGYLQQVNPASTVYTYTSGYSTAQKIGTHYGTLLHPVNTSTAYSSAGFNGAIDCETTSAGTNGALDCVDKNDKIFIFSPTSIVCNPVYLNMYTVESIYRAPKTYTPYESDPANKDSEGIRNKLILNYGLNFAYSWGVCTPFVYKFHASTTTYPDGGYKYSTECSSRGICDYSTGTCQCFHGYTNDNCDTQNALAM